MTAYGLFAAAGVLAAVLWLRRHRPDLGLTENEFWAALWLLVAGAVAGAKGLFVVLGWRHYASGELRLWADFGTGFVFFGGLLGGLAAALGFARWRGLGFARGADYFAVALPLGHAIGRLGCQAQGCCAGRPPHPVPLYEAAALLGLVFMLQAGLARVEDGRWPRGRVFALYLLGYGALRLLLDPLRADSAPGGLLGLTWQQLLAAAAMAAGAVLFRPGRSP
ncbi:MAG TPA: prolipoprotein diacylglyceryl transferase, partial [Verrucomicrobiota bacterium]|nr:prolipoprotein diacylglyceryl transferase [Verrucomicrobiota bacterium]